MIFVKLWQFQRDDQTRVIRRPGEGETTGLHPGVTSSTTLFAGADERVMLEEWQAGAEIILANAEGLELLVLAGGFTNGKDHLERWSWLRLTAGDALRVRVGPEGARVWYKSAPLLHAAICPMDTGEALHT